MVGRLGQGGSLWGLPPVAHAVDRDREEQQSLLKAGVGQTGSSEGCGRALGLCWKKPMHISPVGLCRMGPGNAGQRLPVFRRQLSCRLAGWCARRVLLAWWG